MLLVFCSIPVSQLSGAAAIGISWLGRAVCPAAYLTLQRASLQPLPLLLLGEVPGIARARWQQADKQASEPAGGEVALPHCTGSLRCWASPGNQRLRGLPCPCPGAVAGRCAQTRCSVGPHPPQSVPILKLALCVVEVQRSKLAVWTGHRKEMGVKVTAVKSGMMWSPELTLASSHAWAFCIY